MVLALFAMGGIRDHARRGVWLAASGFLLGIVDVVVWAFLLVLVVPGPALTDGSPRIRAAARSGVDPGAPAALQRAMRANVLIERNVGMAILGGKAIGSGVILRIDRGDALIVTNRHVVDPDFPSQNDNSRRSALPRSAA